MQLLTRMVLSGTHTYAKAADVANTD